MSMSSGRGEVYETLFNEGGSLLAGLVFDICIYFPLFIGLGQAAVDIGGT